MKANYYEEKKVCDNTTCVRARAMENILLRKSSRTSVSSAQG